MGSPSRTFPRSRSRRPCSPVPGAARSPFRGSPAMAREPGRSGAGPRPRAYSTDVVRPGFYPHSMVKNPTRIDLLELDIDLRLTDLWREACEITEWNLDV